MQQAQRYTSERTCRKQVSALIRALLRAGRWQRGDVNADIGGGKWDLATNELARHGVENVVYDRFNRSEQHNERALDRIFQGVETATLANTLNVIAEPERRALLLQLAVQAKVVYVQIHEGDSSGVGRQTRDGWQENRKLPSYVPEVSAVFSRVAICRIGGLCVIEATL